MIEDIIQGSLILCLGMSMTGLFLMLLILMVDITRVIIKALGLDKEEISPSRAGSSGHSSSSDKSKVVAAIAAALKLKK